MSFIVANRVFLKPAFNDEFEKRFKERAGQIDTQIGFVSMQVLRPKSNDTPYVILTQWVDEQAFKNWVGE